MTLKNIILDGGDYEPSQLYPSGSGAVPAAGVTDSPPEESVGELSSRVYGFNTAATRDKLRKANISLNGKVRVPK